MAPLSEAAPPVIAALLPWWGWLLVSIAGALLILLLAAWVVARTARREGRALVKRVMRLPLRAKFRLAWALFTERRVPLVARLLLPALVLYLASPLDIIPDFIPVIGYADDALVLVVGLGLLLRLTPREVLEEHLLALEGGQAHENPGDEERSGDGG